MYSTHLLGHFHPLFDPSDVRIRGCVRHRLMTPDHNLVKFCLRIERSQWHLVLCIQIDDLGLIWPGCSRLGGLCLVDHDASVTLRDFQRLAMQLPASEVRHPLAVCDNISKRSLPL